MWFIPKFPNELSPRYQILTQKNQGLNKLKRLRWLTKRYVHPTWKWVCIDDPSMWLLTQADKTPNSAPHTTEEEDLGSETLAAIPMKQTFPGISRLHVQTQIIKRNNWEHKLESQEKLLVNNCMPRLSSFHIWAISPLRGQSKDVRPQHSIPDKVRLCLSHDLTIYTI